MKRLRQILQGISIAYALFLFFLAPLKFATLACQPEVAHFFPGDLPSILIVFWPDLLFVVAAACLLILTLIAFGLPTCGWTKYQLLYLGGCITFALCSFLGFINAPVEDYARLQTMHICSLMCFALSILIILKNRRETLRYFLAVLGISFAISLYYGLEQSIGGGFDDTLEYIEHQEQAKGVKYNPVSEKLLKQGRVNGTFALCNSFGGFLLTVSPLLLLLLYGFCRKIDKPIGAMAVLMPFLVVPALYLIQASGSRAALGSFVIALAFCILVLPYGKKLKLALLVLFILLFCAGTFFIARSSRKFSSLTARLDYYRCAAQLMTEHPFAGTGWGGFYYAYKIRKDIDSHEVPHMPHNIVLSMGSQCGIAGFLITLLLLAVPVFGGIMIVRRSKSKISVEHMLLLGICVWTIHSLLDVNLQVPGSFAVYSFFCAALLSADQGKNISFRGARLLISIAAAILAIVSLLGGLDNLRARWRFSRLAALCDPKERGMEAFYSQSPDEIKNLLRECVEAAPYSPFCWKTAGDFMFSRGYLSTAAEYYTQGLQRDPRNAAIYYALAMLSRRGGDENGARQYLTKALEYSPHNWLYQKALQKSTN